jgi:hypothetical protein
VSTGEVSSRRGRDVVQAALEVIAVFAFAAWAYIALNAVFHPQSLSWPVTHLAGWPSEDTFGIACFALSFTAALAARILART